MTEQEYLRYLKSRLARCTSYKKDKTMTEQEYLRYLKSRLARCTSYRKGNAE